MNTKAFDKLNYSMAVIGAAADGKRQGCIVNSFVQVASSFPAKFTVSVHKDHATCDAIAAAGSFAITLLAKDCPKDVVNAFGYKSGRVGDKFANFEAKEDAAEYTFIRTYKPIDDRIGDIAYIQWGDGYAFIVNNTNCKSVRFTSGNEVYEEVIPDDTYPYVFFYLSDHTNSTLQFEFLDAEGNELR